MLETLGEILKELGDTEFEYVCCGDAEIAIGLRIAIGIIERKMEEEEDND